MTRPPIGKSLVTIFEELPDPRKLRNQRHKLIDIATVAICAILCGSNNWEQVAQFGRDKIEWFSNFLELPNGIPSHDAFNEFFRFLDPEAFQKKFIEWTTAIADLFPGEVIAIDGKTARCSHDNTTEKKAIHCVNAYASSNRITLGHVKTEEKSNEITAIPKLLDMLAVKGCIVTIDAMGCQRDIAEKIIDKGADYILAVKGNHTKLHDEVKNYFEQAQAVNFEEVPGVGDIVEENNRDRIEKRSIWITEDVDWLPQKNDWEGLKSLIMIKSERCTKGIVQSEIRYFITSLSVTTPKILEKIRAHWMVENGLHWVLDVVYDEDRSRLRKDFGAENFSLLRKLTLNVLKQDTSKKGGIETKRLSAGWDDKYRERLLKGK